MLSRVGWIIAVVAGGLTGVLFFFHSAEPEASAPASSVPGDSRPVAPAMAAQPSAAAAEQTPAPPVDRWIAEAQGGNATLRAQAIAALGTAPRDKAVPVLHRVLTNGEPSVDKPLALKALRELALNHGDKDGRVREAFREVLYHDDGQDELLLADAQKALDDVELAEGRRP